MRISDWSSYVGSSELKGETINTPSMLAVEDALDGLKWAESIGGLKALIQRSEKNLKTVADWAASSGWADFLAERPETRSCTSICLKIRSEEHTSELQSLMRSSYAVFCLKKKKQQTE